MINRIFRIIIALIGVSLGYGLAEIIMRTDLIRFSQPVFLYALYGSIMIVIGAIFYILAPRLIKRVERLLESIEGQMLKQPREDILIGFIGIIFGIIFAALINLPISLLKFPDFLQIVLTLLTIIIYIVSITIGYRLAMKNKEDIARIIFRRKPKNISTTKKLSDVHKKILDTSVIIDGRINQVVSTGFIEGDLIVPNFVLEELQHIADSSDGIKRERGRRGLDIVKELQNSSKIKVVISDKDYKDITEVDSKLLKYASEIDASIITNDFNLNKLAVVQGIKVLNINDLANSVKTVVIPGEKMIVNIVREGREKRQGLAYLEDGTMIVVEDAKDLIGETVEVVVTTVLQTPAGKMIFTKIENV